MAKKILLILGHPDSESYNHALLQAYKKGALQAGATVEEILVGELAFNSNLAFGYRQRTELEPCLLEAQRKIKEADHIVVIHPVWWGAVPGILKGFFDRVLLPGFAFQKRPNSLWWDKLLTGKTGRIIATMDQPTWYYWLAYWAPSHRALKNLTLEFCGIQPVGVTSIGPIRNSTDKFRAQWLKKIEDLGRTLK